MKRFRSLPGCLAIGSACLLTATHAGAQVTKVGDAYQFRIKYAKGKTTHYQMTTQTTMPGGMPGAPNNKPAAMSMTIPMTMTIVSVQGNTAVIKSDIGAMTMNGRAMSKPQTMQMTMDDRGKVVGKATGAGAGMGLENMGGGLPDKPLKVGESFTTNKTVNQMGQNFQMKGVSTFKGIKTIGGKQLAEIATKVSGTGTASMNGTGTSYYNLADGSLNSMNMITDMTITMPGQNQQMHMKVNMDMKTVAK